MCIIDAGHDVTQDPAVSLSVFICNCVRPSASLTVPLSFRSNVNYVPPPQEVRLFLNPFIFLLEAKCWVERKQLALNLMNISSFWLKSERH